MTDRTSPAPTLALSPGLPPVLGLAGYSGSGKTELVTKLVPELRARGLRVSTLKHAHHSFDVDQPGKDSFRHRQAGAEQVLIASAQRWVLMRALRGEPEPDLAALLAKLDPVDLVLVEGFKREPFAKIEVWRAAAGTPSLWRDPGFAASLVAVASPDPKPDDCPLPWLALDDPADIAGFIMQLMAETHGPA